MAVQEWTREPEPVSAPGPDVRGRRPRGGAGAEGIGGSVWPRGAEDPGAGLRWFGVIACFDLPCHVGGHDLDVSCEPRINKSQAATILTSSFLLTMMPQIIYQPVLFRASMLLVIYII